MASRVIEGIELERIVQSSFRIKSGSTVVWVDPHQLRTGEKADLILVTHPHFDHCDPSSIHVIKKADTVIVANEPCVEQLRGTGCRVVGLKEGQKVTEKGVEIRGVPGYNGYHPRGYNLCFLFTLGGKTLFHGGDTDYVPEWKQQMKGVDIALLPIGGTYTMDEEEAAQAVKDCKPRIAIPMHYGYATGGDPQQFKRLVGEAATVEIL